MESGGHSSPSYTVICQFFRRSELQGIVTHP